MKAQQRIFFDFLRFCIGATGEIPVSVKDADWEVLYGIAKKQALIGVLFHGIQQLPKELAPNLDLLMLWMGKAQQIRRRNMVMNLQSAKVFAAIKAKGYRCCILKGQGNAQMYPDAYMRTSGDVDVWMIEDRDKVRKMALALADNGKLDGKEIFKHVEVTMDGIPVELHPIPATLNNPRYDYRLRKWLRRNGDLQCSNIVSLPDEAGKMAVPTNAFNSIYQLCHLYHHYLYEGIGLRQFVDYYFVVKSEVRGLENLKTLTNQFENSSVAALQRELKWLGLWEFAGAVMYVLHEVLGLEEAQMIVPMDEKRGKLLLDEIMQGGNFGHHAAKKHRGTMTWLHNIYRLQKDWKLMWYYPSECLTEPFYRVWHFFWRVYNR